MHKHWDNCFVAGGEYFEGKCIYNCLTVFKNIVKSISGAFSLYLLLVTWLIFLNEIFNKESIDSEVCLDIVRLSVFLSLTSFRIVMTKKISDICVQKCIMCVTSRRMLGGIWLQTSTPYYVYSALGEKCSSQIPTTILQSHIHLI